VNDRRRLALIVTLLGSAFLIAAGVLNLLGQGVASLVCIGLGLVVGLVGIGLRPRTPPAGPSPVGTVDRDRIRTERDDHGEAAAVHMLRAARPELSLLDATRIVRRL
jgi:hypothetical protein